jgi:heme exporter protein B
LRRDLRLALRSRNEVALALIFFVVAVSLFPLGLGAEPELLRRIAPGIIWVCALLAALMSMPRLFAADFADRTLEQIALAAPPLPAFVVGKVLAHWLATGLPLVVLTPVVGLQFGLDGESILLTVATLLLGTPILSLIGSVGAALTLGVRAGHSLLALLVLPLYIPVLVFGAGAVEAAATGTSPEAHLSLLGAGLILALLGTPFAAAAAIRVALD